MEAQNATPTNINKFLKEVKLHISFHTRASYAKLPSMIITTIPLMITVINLGTKWYPNKINLNAFI